MALDETELQITDVDYHLPIENPYLLFVSILYPHKNVAFLIKVFSKVVESRPDLKLVIVGQDIGDAISSLSMQAVSLGIRDKIYFTGGIPDDELRHWYANARAFVFPSLTEGFDYLFWRLWLWSPCRG
jgi:glycosyltransferase involved in cell wall biosynthesis